MGNKDQQNGLAKAFSQIEESILPSISLMLDTLLDASTLCQPGVDADVYAAELRTIALQLESLTKDVEALYPVEVAPQGLRAISRA